MKKTLLLDIVESTEDTSENYYIVTISGFVDDNVTKQFQVLFDGNDEDIDFEVSLTEGVPEWPKDPSFVEKEYTHIAGSWWWAQKKKKLKLFNGKRKRIY